MKKIAGILLASQITLFASAAHMQTLYNQKNYSAVIEEAQRSTSEFGNPELHLLWAYSAEALKKNDMAMSAYERVLMLDPDNIEVRIHLTSLYTNLDLNELATEMSENTEKYQLTPAQRNTLDTLKKSDAHELKISATLSTGYDSNINVSPGDVDIINANEELSTMFSRFTAHLSYTYDLSENKDWYIRADANLFYQNNFESAANYYNIFAASTYVALGYGGDNYDLFLPLEYGRLHYLERDFMETVGLKPKINIKFTPFLIGTFNARYTERTYFDVTDQNRNDTIIGYGAGLYWMFDKNFVYLTSKYDDYRSEYSDSLLFTNKETFNLSAGIKYDVNDWFTTTLNYRYRYSLYDDFLPDISTQRSDYHNQGELKLSKMFLDRIEGSLLYSYSTNKSNYYLAEYNKELIMFSLQYNY